MTTTTMDTNKTVSSDYEESGSSENGSGSESEDSQSEGSDSLEERDSESNEEESGIEYTEEDIESGDDGIQSKDDLHVEPQKQSVCDDTSYSLKIETYSSSEYSSESDLETDGSDPSRTLEKHESSCLDGSQDEVNSPVPEFDYSEQDSDRESFNENGNLDAARSKTQSFESLGSYLEMPSTEIMSEAEIRQIFSSENCSNENEVKPIDLVSKRSRPTSAPEGSAPDIVIRTPKGSFSRLYGRARTPPVHSSTPELGPIAVECSLYEDKTISKHYSTPVVPRMTFQNEGDKGHTVNTVSHLQHSGCDSLQTKTTSCIFPGKSQSDILHSIPSQTCKVTQSGVHSQRKAVVRTCEEPSLTPMLATIRDKENCNENPASACYTNTRLQVQPVSGKTGSVSGLSGNFSTQPSASGKLGGNHGDCGVQRSASRLEKCAKKREMIIQEILHTEKTYQNHLRLIIKYFEEPLREKQIIPGHVIVTIFSNLRQIMSVNQELFQHLTTHQIGEAFLLLGPFLKLYSTYANNHERALATMIEWDQKSPEFAAFRRAQEEEEEMLALKLNALLITPVQRIPRYKLLLTELFENTADDHPDYSAIQEAVKQISAVASHINEHIRQQDNFMKMLAIQKSLSGHNTPRLLTPGRIFLKEGTLKKVSKKGGRSYERKFFLFSDMLMYAKPKLLESGGHHAYVCCCILPLQHCKVTTVFGHSQGQSALFRVECKQESLLLFSDQKSVDSWVSVLRSAIGAFREGRQTLRKASSAKQPVRGADLARLRRQEKQRDPFTAAMRHTPEKVSSPASRTFREMLSSPLTRSRRPVSSPGQLQASKDKTPKKEALKEQANNSQNLSEVHSPSKKPGKRTMESIDFTKCLLPRKKKKTPPEISEPIPEPSPAGLEGGEIQLDHSAVWLNDSTASGGDHSHLSVIPETSFYSPGQGAPTPSPTPPQTNSAKTNMSATINGSEWSFITNTVNNESTNSDRSVADSASPRKRAAFNMSWDRALDTASTAAKLVHDTNVYPACCLQ